MFMVMIMDLQSLFERQRNLHIISVILIILTIISFGFYMFLAVFFDGMDGNYDYNDAIYFSVSMIIRCAISCVPSVFSIIGVSNYKQEKPKLGINEISYSENQKLKKLIVRSVFTIVFLVLFAIFSAVSYYLFYKGKFII